MAPRAARKKQHTDVRLDVLCMRVWYLRFKHPTVNSAAVRKAKLAPILFRRIPVPELCIGIEDEALDHVVERYYKSEALRARSQYTGALRRFLSEAAVGDLVGIRVNQDTNMIFARFAPGGVRLFKGCGDENIKGRPVELLTTRESQILETELPNSVKSYSGTFCNWVAESEGRTESGDDDIDLPDEQEIERRRVYAKKSADQKKQVKFIRVGADLGCGQRLSRIFPGNYFHFIPIPRHNDPEFCRFTYADVVSRQTGKVQTKGRSLMSLRRGDMLVLYAGFDSEDESTWRRLVGIFAFLVVKEAFLFVPAKEKALHFSDEGRDFDPFKEFGRVSRTSAAEAWETLTRRYGDWNQHLLDENSDRMDVIICGDRKQSRLLSKVEALEAFDARARKYVVSKETARKWGLTQGHDLRMSPVRTVDPQLAEQVFDRVLMLGARNSANC